MCRESYNDETLRVKLIELLGKDLRVQQQKVLIENKMEEKKTAELHNVDDKQNGRFNSHCTAVSTGEIKCFFCNEEEEHVATNRSKGTKIIQYFL